MLARLFLCIFVFGTLLYAYIDRQNEITKLRMQIPARSAQLARIEQENTQLQLEIDTFENPASLLEIAKRAEYRHLKYPSHDEVIELRKEF